jgi:serine/threonine protein kinase
VKPLSDAALKNLRAALDEPDLAGTRYALVGRLGHGGMGSVFSVRDQELGREVALKVLTLPGDDVAERLRAEARVLARLEHPGIVPVHDVGTLADGRAYYAMKLVRGVRLDEMARTAQLRPLLRAFERICEAVAFAHDRGVLHRDLKPENVMLGDFGEVLVMDWGLARLAEAAADGAGVVLGTPGYMAPEQARGDQAQVDERSDVYALGAILHFLVSRGGPGRDTPRALEAICRRAMAERPTHRYPSVRELQAEVGRFLDGHAVQVYREGPLERAARLVQRHPMPVALVLTYLLIRIALIVAAR